VAIRVERIRSDIESIARCTETPGAGATRPTFSAAWGAAREFVVGQARACGCEVRFDAAGNVHARPRELGWERRVWLCGSHIDTVPNGGDYDGVAGVVVALELLRSAVDDAIVALPMELIVFAEEEGPTFGLGMLGSRAWTGKITAEELAKLRNASGENYLEAGVRYGVQAAKIGIDRVEANRYRGLIEVHIEQGPGMWQRDQRLAIVRAIAGRRQYRVEMRGQANHAGATAMRDRRDALAGAAEMVARLERLAAELSEDAVITVGRLVNHPNAVNVIPERVEMTIDFRAPDDPILVRGEGQIREMIESMGARRGLKVSIEMTETLPACPMSERVCERLARAAMTAGLGQLPVTVSGALHDSAIMAPVIPTAMLFVPSRDGISHNPSEFSRVEDIAVAAKVVERLVRQPTIAELSAMGRDRFIAVCGEFFEHSPWVAERAWEGRPFASVAELFGRMCQVVSAASAEEQLRLICAHPDLMGRLARESSLTRESAGEQAAAGLNDLRREEIAAFERHNAAYREKFGFPFIICARENRKQAILEAFPRRLANTREQELATALEEVYKIARLRMIDAVWED
jgi:allantoate deiminase